MVDLNGNFLPEIKVNDFQSFPNLHLCSLSFNEIRSIEKDAFNGYELRALYIQDSNLQSIDEGSFDSLINLQNLDLRSLKPIQYKTNAWHFANKIANHEMTVTNTLVHTNFTYSPWNEIYCKSSNVNDKCLKLDNILNCLNVSDLSSVGCQIHSSDFNNILIEFPKDDKQPNFLKVGTRMTNNHFLHNFNSLNGSMSYLKYIKHIEIYELYFDLSHLKNLTSDVTEKVTIKADTVVISDNIEVTYFLSIQARIVKINNTITQVLNAKKIKFITMDFLSVLQSM